MSRPSPLALLCLLSLFSGLRANAAPPQAPAPTPSATIRRVTALGRGNVVELEIAASEKLTPQAQVLTAPDRLVIDFPGAIPASSLHPLALDRGEVKSIRVGLFGAHPPVTRVVIDLKTPQPYQLFPSGNTLLVKIGGAVAAVPQDSSPANPALNSTPANSASEEDSFIGVVVAGAPQIRPLTALGSNQSTARPSSNNGQDGTVSFRNGLLRIKAQNATLAQVLFEVQQQTGADIGVPAGAAQERVVTDLGPAPPKEVLAALLNGSSYNFIIMGSEAGANSLGRVILTPKSGGAPEPYIAPEPQQTTAVEPPVTTPEPAPAAVIAPPDMPPDHYEATDPPTQAPPQPN